MDSGRTPTFILGADQWVVGLFPSSFVMFDHGDIFTAMFILRLTKSSVFVIDRYLVLVNCLGALHIKQSSKHANNRLLSL